MNTTTTYILWNKFLEEEARNETRHHSMLKALVLLAIMLLTFSQANSKNKERIAFDLKFGVIKGGEAVMIVTDTTYNGKKAINYYLKGHTTGLSDKIFKVNDIYETTVDAVTYLPYRSVRNIKERKYRYYNEAFFFQDKDSLFSAKTGGIKVPHNLSDILSVSFYFIKKNIINNIENGKQITVPTLHGDDIQDIKIKFIGFETIETAIGKVECYVISPVVDKGKVLKRSDGVRVYISRKDKIMVQLDFETKVGTIRAELSSYKINGKEQIKK